VKPYPMDAKYRNPAWGEQEEAGFWRRANETIRAYADNKGGATTGEHEKWGYPKAMLAILAGNVEPNVRYLGSPDGEQANTLNVDFYWCFTVKGQMRKYFFFGRHAGLLSGGYLDHMRKAAKVWTDQDPRPTMELVLSLDSKDPQVRQYALSLLEKMKAVPLKDLAARATNDDLKRYIASVADKIDTRSLGADAPAWRAWYKGFADMDWKVFEEYERIVNPRPHPKYGCGSGPVGASWDAGTRGGWADARCTDNLRSMRETSVYLMAEEAGNETVRRLYKDKLRRFVWGLYSIGMGEWDSENYHAHTIAPWLNCYDFARDPEVKLMAKAALDWLLTAGALKYYRGGFGGPTKRDYGGGNVVFGAGASHVLYLYFGDCPIADPNPHEDDVHAITSNYRPPPAVVALARKDFARPVEQRDTKPTYSNWLPGADDVPEFWETLFFGRTYYLGTCVSRSGSGDVGPFKLLAYNSKRGCDFVVAYSGSRWNTMRKGDHIGQYRNLVIHLRKGAETFNFLLPKTAKVETDGGIWFVRLEKTWLAIRPIGLGDYKLGPPPGAKDPRRYKDETVLSARSAGGAYSGYAMEVGEEPTSYDAFKAAVKARGSLAPMGVRPGYVLTGSDGHALQAAYNGENDLPIVACQRKARQWLGELDVYKPSSTDGPVSLGWNTGALTVKAGGHLFTCTVTRDGHVTFESR